MLLNLEINIVWKKFKYVSRFEIQTVSIEIMWFCNPYIIIMIELKNRYAIVICLWLNMFEFIDTIYSETKSHQQNVYRPTPQINK